MSHVELRAIPDIPPVRPGDDLGTLILQALRKGGLSLQPGDILAVAQKVVSKAEGQVVRLTDIKPSPRATEIGQSTGRDPRLVEAVLMESKEVLRATQRALVVEQRLGVVCANAGVDQSNVEGEEEWVTFLPKNPDASAKALRKKILEETGVEAAILIVDTHGRAFRRGVVGVAIGAAGLIPLLDLRGEPDLFGRKLENTQVAQADEVASAASLVMGQGAEGTPVILVRGIRFKEGPEGAKALFRPKEEDLFRGQGTVKEGDNDPR
jgi:coenzyme F420-0:L-glutamate ligase/coenzyme F420-1:gamma-L-glutamate ligase